MEAHTAALAAEPSFTERHYFLIRRLHSLTGLVPIGVFLCVHLLTNASILAPGAGGEQYQKSVDRIHGLGPLLLPVEIVGIFIPILFHALLGFQIILTAKHNSSYYRYGSNVRYTLQHVTGTIAFFYMAYHVWHMHWIGKPLGGGTFDPHAAAMSTAVAIQANVWIAPIYALGIVASVYHLANGIWTALITWGITIRPQTQRFSGYVCAVFGVVLCLFGLGALYGFRTFTRPVNGKLTGVNTVILPTNENATNSPDWVRV